MEVEAYIQVTELCAVKHSLEPKRSGPAKKEVKKR